MTLNYLQHTLSSTCAHVLAQMLPLRFKPVRAVMSVPRGHNLIGTAGSDKSGYICCIPLKPHLLLTDATKL